jgi:Major capsid protein N-terminus/Large eukaryotic DNA virus major capsid protein
MSGGEMQLFAIGSQDVYLTESPEISFFQSSYKRHTNFSHVVSRQVLQGTPSPSNMSSVRFERKGDLLSYVYLTKKDSSGNQVRFNDINQDETSEFEYIELLIGGQVIDTQDCNFMRNISKLIVSSSNKSARNTYEEMFLPLQFWFCQSWQSALPLIALQYHDVEIRIHWKEPGDYVYECWADFIFLDNLERQDMASRAHTILMYQVQKQLPSGGNIQNLVFNHPIKFLASSENLVSNTESSTIVLQINGVDIGEQKTYTPHYDYIPNYYTTPNLSANPFGFLYPFCLDTSKIQPTGSLNFSRIDSARFISSETFDKAPVYAVNYNILHVENGMGGLKYAN